MLGTSFVISDYLLQNLIQLTFLSAWVHWDPIDDTFGWNKENSNLLDLQYMNTVHTLNWTLGYASEFTTERIQDHIGYIGLYYPLLQKGRWSSYFSSLHGIQRYNYDNELFSFSRGTFSIRYSQSFPFNYFLPNKSASLQVFIDHQYLNRKPEWNGWKGGVIGNSMAHIGQNYYLMPSASYAVSLNEEINPVEIHSYRLALPSNLDDKQKENSPLHSNILYSDDTTDTHFIPFDLFRPISQRRYLAKGIGTASLGLKKMFPNPSSITTASFRSRWVVLEQSLSYKPLLLTPEQGASDVDPNRLYAGTITDLTKQLRPRDEKKLEPEYTHWLEWTFGLEYLYMLQNNIPFVIGLSFGFRTSVKFWEDHGHTNGSIEINGETMEEAEELAPTRASFNHIGHLNSPTLSSNLLNDPSIQLYVKIPL